VQTVSLDGVILEKVPDDDLNTTPSPARWKLECRAAARRRAAPKPGGATCAAGGAMRVARGEASGGHTTARSPFASRQLLRIQELLTTRETHGKNNSPPVGNNSANDQQNRTK